MTRPLLLLRLEGLAIGVLAFWGFAMTDVSWVWLLVLLAPDLSMIGYLGGDRLGASFYNAAHTYLAPALVSAAVVGAGVAGVADEHIVLVGTSVALLWAAHIGFDRALGYGLKQPDGFHRTHLGPIGPARRG